MPSTVRLIKIGMIYSIAMFFTLVALNNLLFPTLNTPFVQHVLSMDTVTGHQNLTQRAITNSNIHHSAFYLITSTQILAATFCWMGGIQMSYRIKESTARFNQAKNAGLLGLFIGFLLYLLGFITIGGEWFFMWRSSSWNGQNTAGIFLNFILLIMIFIALPTS